MIVQITLTRNELFLIKEMMPHWQKYADGFVFMVDRSDDGTIEFLNENKTKYNILSILTTEVGNDTPPIESEIRQRLFDEAFKHSGNIVCLDTDEYLDGNLTKEQLEIILEANKDTLIHAQWIQYTGINEIRVDGPWGFNLKDRIGSYSKATKFKSAQMHSEHLPVPEKQVSIGVPMLFIAHLQWLDKKAVAIKQYYWKIVDYVHRTQFGIDTIPASAYDASVNNFNWQYKTFDFPLKVVYDVFNNQSIEDNYKYKFIKMNVKQYNIPNLNDWGMSIHNDE
jgi:hypothetical protein